MFADLYVVSAVSNPERYRSRYVLYKDFEKRCIDAGAKLYTVETAFGERPHIITQAGNPQHVQLRTSSQIWHKENMLNIGVSRLPHDWKYVAWIDTDVLFARPDWVAETVHQLQHFDVVQMFSHVMDLDPSFSPAPQFYAEKPASYIYCHHASMIDPAAGVSLKKGGYGQNAVAGPEKFYWHPGFAWAARRSAWDALGGLFDYSIVGGADYLMSIALTRAQEFPGWTQHGSFGRYLNEWRERADRHIRGNVGFVPGMVMHNWHGRKAQRQYKTRWRIYNDNKYEPEVDLKRDWQGLWQLTDHNPKLRDDIRNYFRARNEDSIDVQ